MKRLLPVFLLAFFLAFSAFSAFPVSADYMTPEEAGFRNCALIYHSPANLTNAEYFKRLLVKYEADAPTDQAGFDSFLFLYFTVNGKQTALDETHLTDWNTILDAYFHSAEINVPQLAKAVRELKDVGKLDADAPIKIWFAIPWLNQKVLDFGDVNGDGKTENLSTEAGRDVVLHWYINTAKTEMKRFPELKLEGFYMMTEGMGERNREEFIQYNRVIHDEGFRTFWIPYYNASGLESAYDVGFDVVILQSNWTFNTRPDGSGTRRNRLVQAADFARKHHFGIELEINTGREPNWWEIYRQSLETGTQTGFQKAVSAVYFGTDFYWPTSENAECRELYALWMDYVAGKPVSLPKPGTWSRKDLKNGVTQFVYTLNEPQAVQLFDVFLEEDPENGFEGLVQAECHSEAGAPWEPLAWLLHTGPNPMNGTHQNITLNFPGTQKTHEIRLTFTPKPGKNPLGTVTELLPDLKAPVKLFSKCFRKPYTTNTRTEDAITYPDETGRQLLDGVVSTKWSENVGWFGTSPARIDFSFGETLEFDEIRVCTMEGPDAGIHWPAAVSAIYSLEDGIPQKAGFGLAPKGISTLNGFEFNPEKKRFEAHFGKISARSLSLFVVQNGWLFLSEVQFLRDGKVLPTEKMLYRLSTQQRGGTKDRPYQDDGQMLTDGQTSTNYARQCVGMSGKENLKICIDLEQNQPVEKVTAMILDGGTAGIWLASAMTVRFSADGENWSDPIAAKMPEREKRPALVNVPVSVSAPEGQTARFVELEIKPFGWAFVTEVLVH